MASVLQFALTLEKRPEIPAAAGISVRNYTGPEDIPVWLELRHRAFARSSVGVRHWSEADFQAEFTARPDWSPTQLWFAERQTATGVEPVGTVAVVLRKGADETRPAVHWLAVLPQFRRRGVGQLLLATLEQSCWDAGYRGVWLETHAAWTAARALYEARGYRLSGADAAE